LGIAPYGGFINPEMQAVYVEGGEIGAVEVTYPDDFASQMLRYSATYGLLPENNEYQKK
jgi:dipeptidyl-peptidase-3